MISESSLNLTSLLSLTVYHSWNLGISKIKALQSYWRLNISRSWQNFERSGSRAKCIFHIIYITSFSRLRFDSSECRQRRAGCLPAFWIGAWTQQQLSRCCNREAPAAPLHCVSEPHRKCFSISDTYQSAGVWQCHYSKLITTVACLSSTFSHPTCQK